MSSAGPPTYSTTVPTRPELQHLNMPSYFSAGQTPTPPILRPGYDEEATQMKGLSKKQSLSRKKVPSLEKVEDLTADVSLGAQDKPVSSHNPSYSLGLGSPPDN